MKNIFSINNNWKTWSLLLGMFVFVLGFTSCEDKEDNNSPMTISKIFYQDAESSVPDREVEFARLGQLIRIEGSGFSGLRRVYINGRSSYFNPVLVSDNSMIIRVSSETPTIEADPAERNTIRFVKGSVETVFNFEIRAAAPSITNISNTLPAVGDYITIYGTGLTEINKITFPGNIIVSEGIVSDEEGEFCIVQMPAGVSEEGGSILLEGVNGGAYSPAYFNAVNNILLDFDGKGNHASWGSSASMITPDDLESAIIGVGITSRGNYAPHLPLRIDSVAAARTRCSEVWSGEDSWRDLFTPSIPATTSARNVGFQFDIYVPEEWAGSGFLKICLVNGFNGGEWSGNCYNYIPWLVDKEVVPFQTIGWTTVTIPFSDFYTFRDTEEETFTFENVLAARDAASNKQFGIYFENSNIVLNNVTKNDADKETEFLSSKTSVKVYTDNWRIVSLETPTYSDFED